MPVGGPSAADSERGPGHPSVSGALPAGERKTRTDECSATGPVTDAVPDLAMPEKLWSVLGHVVYALPVTVG